MSEENRDVIGELIGGGQIEPAIPVEVPDRDTERENSYAEVPRAIERSVPQSQQHRNVVAECIGSRNVGPPVAVEVASDVKPRAKTKGIIVIEVHQQRLIGRDGWLELRADGVRAGPAAKALDLEEVGSREQVLGNQVVRVGGGLSVALDQQPAIAPQKGQARVGPGGVDLRGQPARLGQGDFVEVGCGQRAGGRGQMVGSENERDGELGATARQSAVFQPFQEQTPRPLPRRWPSPGACRGGADSHGSDSQISRSAAGSQSRAVLRTAAKR